MANDRLHDALLQAELSLDEVASKLGVDRKTVERWISADRLPYRRHRHQLAVLLQQPEAYLWPAALGADRRTEVGRSEIIDIYAHRADSPIALWSRLFDNATERLDILVYAALFLPEQDPQLVRRLVRKAASGVQMRLIFGDPDSLEVAQRGSEERIGSSLGYRIRNSLHHFEPLRVTTNVEIRLHSTVLYNSIFRSDDEMLVTPHVYGLLGAHAPLIHLRRLSEGSLFTTYAESFERVWMAARPVQMEG